jgi:hypothetical protein
VKIKGFKDFKDFKLLHDAMFCLVCGALVSGFAMAVTGEPMGLISSLASGHLVMKGLERATAKRRSAEVSSLKSLYERPSNTEK